MTFTTLFAQAAENDNSLLWTIVLVLAVIALIIFIVRRR